MKSMTTLSLLSVLSAFVFAGCATGEEADTESLGEAQQAITLDAASPAASVATKDKKLAPKTHLAGALGTTTIDTSGYTLDTNLVVPAQTTVTCTTFGATSMDTVLALMILQNPYAAAEGPTDQSYDPQTQQWSYTTQKGWNLVAFNDDDPRCQGYQSTVSFRNSDNIARNIRLVGFLYPGSSTGGTATVTCTGADQTSINATFGSNSTVIYQPSTTITLTSDVGNPDTTLLAISTGSSGRTGCSASNAGLANGNSASNEDCPAGGPVGNNQSCLTNMNTGGYYWIVDLGRYGTKPRTTTVTF